MSRWNLAWLLGIAAIASVGFAASQSAPSREKDKDYELVRLVVDVLSEVDHNYVRQLDDNAKRKLVEDMVNGGLERLDPHSAFINPHRFKQFDRTNKGEFGGIGIEVSDDGSTGVLRIEGLLAGTPAYEAGLQAGDLVVKVDGKSTQGMLRSDAIDLIQGEAGQKIKLTVLHEGGREPVEVEMTRARIHVESVRGEVRRADRPSEWEYVIDKASQIACVRLTNFGMTTAEELRVTLSRLRGQGMRGLVLDLRSNPGGLLRGAVEVSNLFMGEGRIVSTKGRNNFEEIHDARSDKVLLPPGSCPVVVLINRFSASASEIVAAALQDHQRAVVIGERSFGKGSVQNVIRMEDGASALKLTTASYWRPSGKNIHRFPDAKETDEWGVSPDKDFEVKLTDLERLAFARQRRDRDKLYGKAVIPPKKNATKETKRFEDRVLQRGLEYLRRELNSIQVGHPPALKVG